jgi:MYXO-CTERM domain-containing protein
LVLVAVAVTVAGTNIVAHTTTPPDTLGWLLLLAGGGALAFRRRWPVAVMWVTIAAGLIYDTLDTPGAFYTVPIVLGIFSAAAFGRRWAATTGAGATLVLFYVGDLILATGHMLTAEGALWFGGWITAGVLLGEVARGRTDRIAATEQRARDNERHRQEEALRRAGEERIRIARELHDVLAHSISIINVQAGVAAHHLDTDPEKSRAALATVRETGKHALHELRSSLGVLRDPGSVPVAPRAPSPGASDIDQLVEATRETGLNIDLQQSGDLVSIPPDVGLAAYRVIQENLTNVTRHANATVVTVRVERRPGELILRVEDNGDGSGGDPEAGHGIVGMRERLRALGGEFDAGPRPDGGFQVSGTIPLRDLP